MQSEINLIYIFLLKRNCPKPNPVSETERERERERKGHGGGFDPGTLRRRRFDSGAGGFDIGAGGHKKLRRSQARCRSISSESVNYDGDQKSQISSHLP